MTEQELAEIEARANAATAGPWGVDDTYPDCENCVVYLKPDVIIDVDDGCARFDREDGLFIAHARTDVPALLIEVRRLQGLIREVEWEGGAGDPHEVAVCCPWCRAYAENGEHAPDCPAFGSKP